MNDDFKLSDDGPTQKAVRLENLRAERGETADNINTGYSRFIKKVQFALPIMALLLIGLIFGWNHYEGDKIVAVKQEDIRPEIRQEIGKNELVNPRFESMDEKGQPFTLTADKAIQDSADESGEMLLENPSGIMALNSGDEVKVTSESGSYRQIEQSLDLNKNVILKHSTGYELKTEIMHVDLAENTAWSEQAVRVTGPEGQIDSSGIKASSESETVIFQGPAKMLLIMDNTDSFGEMLP